MINITLTKTPKQKPAGKLGFGKYFSDHMFFADYDPERGWHNFTIAPFGQMGFDPATSVFHYGQGIFEGLKAYRDINGDINFFRPRDNFARLNNSASRLVMPHFPVDTAIEAMRELVKIEKDWIPSETGTSLYIRPFMISTGSFLGVKASDTYRFFIILSPVGSYYENGLAPTKIYVEETYTRAAHGGTGSAKCLANYSASLLSSAKAHKLGFDQVLWLDAEKKYVEEVGAMNIFFVLDGVVTTPDLNGDILAGITRDSVLQILKKAGIPTSERRLTISEVIDGAKSGALTEMFGTGTAAVISPVGSLRYKDVDYTVGKKMGKISTMLYDMLTGIQRGWQKDEFGWITKL